mmetsp:Transcript_7110/g.10629  ORF Transcript_7110/g.10629 Transcript_7110/m.10629 type:complete len:357 (-) Transcript_7110:509-1579(-)
MSEDSSWHSIVLLPNHILDNSPSKQDDIDPETEKIHRIFGAELIQEAGILLRLPQVVMCTGQTILQRFFYRKSLMKFDAFSVAMSCLLLSSKIEEASKVKLRDVVLVFHRMYLRRKNLPITFLDTNGPIYIDLKSEIYKLERYILKELGFGFYNILDHPHKFILYYAQVLNWKAEPTQSAWNYLNDSLRTDLCLRYRSEVLASAAIYLSARKLQLTLPNDPPWWELFNAELKDIGAICNTIQSLYKQRKIVWIEPINKNSIFSEMKGICLKIKANSDDKEIKRDKRKSDGGEKRNKSEERNRSREKDSKRRRKSEHSYHSKSQSRRSEKKGKSRKTDSGNTKAIAAMKIDDEKSKK